MLNMQPILSEKPEDQIRSGKWLEEYEKRVMRNKKIGDETWKRDILPKIRALRQKTVK